jgi:uncharacterized protein
MSRHVVFDTTTVISALLFTNGRLGWLRQHWKEAGCIPLLSQSTASELARVLGYPKFHLSQEDRRELLGDYMPYCEIVKRVTRCPQTRRDEKDQPFLDLAQGGGAELLVSGDNDLLALAGQTAFIVETPEAYRLRVEEDKQT